MRVGNAGKWAPVVMAVGAFLLAVGGGSWWMSRLAEKSEDLGSVKADSLFADRAVAGGAPPAIREDAARARTGEREVKPKSGIDALPRSSSPLVVGVANLPPAPDVLIPLLPLEVGEWLTCWQANELTGRSATAREVESLVAIVRERPVSATHLAQLVALVAKLDGAATVGPLFPLLVEAVGNDLGAVRREDERAKDILAALWMAHEVVWEAGDYPTSQRLLELLRPWGVRGSAHSQWASYIYAENLMLQEKYREAYLAFQESVAERAEAREPARGINRSLDWELGLTAFHSGDYLAAVGHFRIVSERVGVEQREATSYLIRALARTGEIVEARNLYESYVTRYGPGESEATLLVNTILTCVEAR